MLIRFREEGAAVLEATLTLAIAALLAITSLTWAGQNVRRSFEGAKLEPAEKGKGVCKEGECGFSEGISEGGNGGGGAIGGGSGTKPPGGGLTRPGGIGGVFRPF